MVTVLTFEDYMTLNYVRENSIRRYWRDLQEPPRIDSRDTRLIIEGNASILEQFATDSGIAYTRGTSLLQSLSEVSPYVEDDFLD